MKCFVSGLVALMSFVAVVSTQIIRQSSNLYTDANKLMWKKTALSTKSLTLLPSTASFLTARPPWISVRPNAFNDLVILLLIVAIGILRGRQGRMNLA